MLSDIISQSRKILHDESSPYRWSDSDMVLFVNEGIRDIVFRRPDALIDAYGQMMTIADIPSTGNYIYMRSGTPATSSLDNLSGITGWDREAVPKLYFYAFAGNITRAYASAANRTAGIAAGDDTGCLFKFTDNESGTVSITAVVAGYAGTVYISNVATASDTYEYEASEQELQIGNGFDTALVHFLAHKCLDMDSEDTANMNRSRYEFGKYINYVHGGLN